MIEKVSWEDFIKRGELASPQAVKEALQHYPDAVGVVLFQNLMMDSSSFGDSSSVIVGPSNTFTSAEACEGKWLKDLPSQRQYPVAWVSKEDVLKKGGDDADRGSHPPREDGG